MSNKKFGWKLKKKLNQQENKSRHLSRQRLKLFTLRKCFFGQFLKEVVLQNNADTHQ